MAKFGACEAIQDRLSGEWSIYRDGRVLMLFPATETQALLLAALIGDLTSEQWTSVITRVSKAMQDRRKDAA